MTGGLKIIGIVVDFAYNNEFIDYQSNGVSNALTGF